MRFEFKFSETYLLSNQLCLVFFRDSVALYLAKLLLLNLQELLPVIFNLISGLLAFFEIVKSSLFADFRIFADLANKRCLVSLEGFELLFIQFFLVFFLFLLLLNDPQELFTLSLCLLS